MIKPKKVGPALKHFANNTHTCTRAHSTNQSLQSCTNMCNNRYCWWKSVTLKQLQHFRERKKRKKIVMKKHRKRQNIIFVIAVIYYKKKELLCILLSNEAARKRLASRRRCLEVLIVDFAVQRINHKRYFVSSTTHLFSFCTNYVHGNNYEKIGL